MRCHRFIPERLCPLVITPRPLMTSIVSLLAITRDDVFIDLGSGDGRVVVGVSLHSEVGRAVGVEISSLAIEAAETRAQDAGVKSRVKFVQGSFADSSFLRPLLAKATCIYCYLMQENLELLSPLLQESLDRGARLVSLEHDIPALGTPTRELILLAPRKT